MHFVLCGNTNCTYSLRYQQPLHINRQKQLLALCLSVCLHGTTWLPLEEFSWNLIFEYFWKSVTKVEVSSLKRITGNLYVDLGTCISVLDRSCRENQNTHFMFSNFPSPPKHHANFEMKMQHSWTGHRWQSDSTHTFWHIEYVILLLLSMATMVPQTHLKVTWCICYLSCFLYMSFGANRHHHQFLLPLT